MADRDHLVVVVPGIGGSVLARADDPEDVVWSAGLRSVGDILRRPERLSVEEYPRLRAVGLIKSRKAFGVWTVIPGYDGLLSRLAALPGVVLDDGTGPARMDANVVAVGYDFRLGVEAAARELDRQIVPRLKHLWAQSERAGRVVIIAHSLGGLVARCWAGQDENAPLCRAIMTLGTPYRGAAKALDVLANGVAVAGVHLIRRPREVLRSWPSMYELLPRETSIATTGTVSAEERAPGSEASVAEQRSALVRVDQLPIDWLRGEAGRAREMHQHVDELWRRPGRPFLAARIGYGHGTLRRVEWDGARVRVSRDAPVGPELGLWDGDRGGGTVPAYSALPSELGGVDPNGLRVRFRHGPICDLPEVTAWVEAFERRPALRPVEGDQRPASLAIDLDEVALAGSPIPVTARVVGTTVPAEGATVAAKIRADAGPVITAYLQWDSTDAAFHGALPAVGPGVYSFTIDAEEVPKADDLHTSETLGVVGDDLD